MILQNMKKKHGTKEITTEGQIKNFGTEENPRRLCSNINYSSILSRLIVEAGKRCEAYASDLFISWESMLNDISKIEGNTNLTYYFGFRDMGVDHGGVQFLMQLADLCAHLHAQLGIKVRERFIH